MRRAVHGNRRAIRPIAVMAVLALAALGIGGCGSDSNSLDVSLYEWGVDYTGSPSAGTISVSAANDGGEIHELVIVRADSIDGFIVDDTGKVDEAGFDEADFLGEIEEFAAGTTESADFDLSAGTYVLFCNIVELEEDGTYESHFVEGMYTTITID